MRNRALLQFTIWLVLIIAGALVLRTTSITHDLTQFLPKGATKQQQLAVNLVRTGPASRMILIALVNAPAEKLAKISRNLTLSLEQSDLFAHISNGARLNTDNLDLVFRYRYLLDPNTNDASFSEQSLKLALQQRLNELTSALPLLDSKLIEADPTASFRSVVSIWQSHLQPHLYNGVWFSADNKRALIVATTLESGFDPEAQQQVIDLIRASFDKMTDADGARLLLSGAPVFASSARNTIRSNLQVLSITASILVIGLLLLAYRSFYILILAGIPIITGLIAGSLITAFIFGNLHGITLVFGITLLGVAIDYPIHVFSHLSPEETPKASVLHIWPTLRLGIITTCIGYLAFARHDFSGLAQLGIFTTCGLLSAAAVTRWLLPTLLTPYKPQNAGINSSTTLASKIQLPQITARLTLAAAVVTCILLLITTPPEWETDLSALSPLSSAERELDTRLRSSIGVPDASQLIVINGNSTNAVLKTSEQIAAKLQQAVDLGLLSGFDAASRYLPSAETQKMRQAALPDIETATKRLQAAVQNLPFKQDAFSPFLDALSASRKLAPLTLEDIAGTPAGLRTQPMVFKDQHEWNALILLSGIHSHAEFRNWWSSQQISNAQLISLKETSADMLAQFRNSTLERLLLGIVAIFILLSFGLKSPTKALMALIPVILAVCLTTAMLAAIGERLSLFHLVALLLTTGIGIDYSLFFQRRETLDAGRQHITNALIICVISTVTVFGILATSSIPVLHSIGLTVALGAPLCFILALSSSSAGYLFHKNQE